MGEIDLGDNSTRKGLAAIYRQEIIQDVTLFTSQPMAPCHDTTIKKAHHPQNKSKKL